jgi:exopolysaccharide production protein ExoQ
MNMTKMRWLWELTGFALLSVIALYAMAPFRSNLIILLVFAVPFVLVYVVPSAARALMDNAAELTESFTWWHWLILISFVSGLTFRLREVQEIQSNPLDVAAMVKVILVGVIGALLLARLFTGKSPWLRSQFRGLLGLLMVFTLISLVSTFWSVKPSWTLYKSLEYAVMLALYSSIVVYASRVEEYESVLNWIYALLTFLLVTAWVGAVIDPADAFNVGAGGLFLIPQLNGVFPVLAANGVGTMGAILALVAISRLTMPVGERTFRGWYVALAGFAIVTMILADCRSATFGFLVGILVLLFFTRHLVSGTFVLASGAVLALLSGAGKNIMLYLARGQHTKELEGLSGRVDFWRFAWQKFLERPFTGWGGFAGGRFLILPQITDPSQPMPSDLHSNIMEPLVDTGIFGLLFILLALFGVWWYLYKGYRSPRLNASEARFAAECMVVLALLSVRFTVSDFTTIYPGLPFLAILCYAESVRRRLKFGDPSQDFSQQDT